MSGLKVRTFLLSFFLAVGASAAPLSVVTVEAPALKCKFDPDCQPLVADTAGGFPLPGAEGQGAFLSRTWPVGKAGTPVAGLQVYLYQLDLSGAAGKRPCVSRLRFDFGPVAPFDYNGDGKPDEVFVIGSGGPGSVGPSAASQSGEQVTFDFDTPVCAGDASFFFGLASIQPPRPVLSEIALAPGGGTLSLDARAPQLLGGGATLRLTLPRELVRGRPAILRATGARPGAVIELYAGQRSGATPVKECSALTVDIERPDLVARAVADAEGQANLPVAMPVRLLGRVLHFQAVEHPACRASRLVSARSGS